MSIFTIWSLTTVILVTGIWTIAFTVTDPCIGYTTGVKFTMEFIFFALGRLMAFTMSDGCGRVCKVGDCGVCL